MSDDEQYTYSDEDDDEYDYTDDEQDSKMDLDHSATQFQIPDSTYKIIDYLEIYPMLKHMMEEVASLLGVSLDHSLVLLHEYRWNKEKLVEEYFSNSNKTLEKSGILVSDAVALRVAGKDDMCRENYCRICLSQCDAKKLYGLSCGHKFCSDCYKGYLDTVIGDGPICVTATCPEHQCNQKILADTVKSLCDASTYEKYLMYMTRNFIETSSTMRWCPAPGCEKVAVGSSITTVVCSCTNSFCFRCGGEAHDPATCRQLEMWLEKCQSESETANWILANTKKCPKCSARIEKNQGCNHMTCKVCKYDFCWICCGDWQEHGQNTGGYYKCNKYDPTKPVDGENAASKAKAELDRYLHYYKRYQGHDMSLKFASKQRDNAEKRMLEMQESEKSAWIGMCR
jgi:ariadne-1